MLLFHKNFFGYIFFLILSIKHISYGLAQQPESTDDIPDIELEDNTLEPDQMGHINLGSFKEGQCPEIACPLIKAPKPCPHARPVKTVFRWMNMECEGCSSKWDPDSCKKGPGDDDAGSHDDVICPDLSCPEIKDKKPCADALPVPNKVIFKGKQCRGCPFKWNSDSCDPEKRKKMDLSKEELFVDDTGHAEL